MRDPIETLEPRQRRPVTMTLRGNPWDVEHYAARIKRAIEVNHDIVERHHEGPDHALVLTIHPGAVNE